MRVVGVLVLVLSLAGCAGRGDVVGLQIARSSMPASSPSSSDVRSAAVVVVPFQDARAEKGRLGSRTHLWGGLTHFDLAGGPPGERLAQALVDHLQRHGQPAALWRSPERGEAPRAVVTGEIRDLRAGAESRFGSTRFAVALGLVLHVANPDGTTGRFTLNASRSDSAPWFDPQDLEGLLNDVLRESFEKFVGDSLPGAGLSHPDPRVEG